jgi:exonuclease III
LIVYFKELLNENLVDMIIVGEIKLDETFRNGEFPVDNFHLWRADRTANGGGLLVYIRSDLACERKNKLECEHIESFSPIIIILSYFVKCFIKVLNKYVVTEEGGL